MKKLVLIFCVLNLFCFSQNGFGKHYGAGIAISGFCSSSMYFATKKPALSSISGLFTGIIAGIVKEEVYDRQFKKGTPSLSDKAGTGCGSAFSTIHFTICIHEIRKARQKKIK